MHSSSFITVEAYILVSSRNTQCTRVRRNGCRVKLESWYKKNLPRKKQEPQLINYELIHTSQFYQKAVYLLHSSCFKNIYKEKCRTFHSSIFSKYPCHAVESFYYCWFQYVRKCANKKASRSKEAFLKFFFI
jgi:hypothetical protein